MSPSESSQTGEREITTQSHSCWKGVEDCVTAEALGCPGRRHGENHPELSPEAEVGLPVLGTWRAQLREMRPAPGPVTQQTLWCGRDAAVSLWEPCRLGMKSYLSLLTAGLSLKGSSSFASGF